MLLCGNVPFFLTFHFVLESLVVMFFFEVTFLFVHSETGYSVSGSSVSHLKCRVALCTIEKCQ